MLSDLSDTYEKSFFESDSKELSDSGRMGLLVNAGVAAFWCAVSAYILFYMNHIKNACPRIDKRARQVTTIVIWIQLIVAALTLLCCFLFYVS